MTDTQAADFTAGMGPELQRAVESVLALWPAHAKFLRASFAGRSEELLDTSETVAALLGQVAVAKGRPLSAYAEDYRYLCEQIVFPEEIFFRREGRYRLSTFAEANAQVYANAELMSRYMNGLFLSDALWFNHASAMNDFAKSFLPSLPRGGNHLEIGPGHGMLLHLASRYGAFSTMTAWDVSPTSIAHAGEVLEMLGERQKVDLVLMDLYAEQALANGRGRFDAVVLSEVLEHLEQPLEALGIIRDLLAPGGKLWINVPANGPAPDHLFLLRSPDELEVLVRSAGLKITRSAAFPVAGSSLERAVRQELPVSCCVVAERDG